MKKKENSFKDAEQNTNKEGLDQNIETCDECNCEKEQSDTPCSKEVEEIKAKLEEKSKQCEDYFDKLQRTAAEFDNFKKRTVKEKEALYSDATSEVVAAFLPVVDNLERAIEAANKDVNANSLKEGVELVYRQMKDVLQKLNVEVIEAVGNEFDPNLHNAVSHVDDEQYGNNIIIEEFQKGYMLKDKVIRYSMVKVAN
ncbi:MAG: nucleotide exchange factor GrpE [Clostridiaceae bacterium]|jgi:molecular chaperone GrpE|nr:nucleotide exchange factor GrpE [Clostridiaceae bacterium]